MVAASLTLAAGRGENEKNKIRLVWRWQLRGAQLQQHITVATSQVAGSTTRPSFSAFTSSIAMKILLIAAAGLLALSAVTLDGVDAGRPRHHHKNHSRKGIHQHHHNMKFQEVDVVGANKECPRGGSVVLCSSLSDECQDGKGSGSKQGIQVCLPRDASFLDAIDAKTTGPWNECTTSDSDSELPTKCLFGFQCVCDDLALKECYCVPPDAFRMSRGTPDSCKTSDGEIGCDAGKYCRTKGSKQECADAPYLPGLPLYAQCGDDSFGSCQDGLTCKKYHDAFSMCVKEKSLWKWDFLFPTEPTKKIFGNEGANLLSVVNKNQCQRRSAKCKFITTMLSVSFVALSYVFGGYFSAHVHGYHVSVHAHALATTTTAPESIRYTRVVPDFQSCGSYGGQLAMCASKGFVCRMKRSQAAFASAPSCLPYDPRAPGANTLEEKATPPWSKCDPDYYDVNLPTCRLSFACMCQAQHPTSSESGDDGRVSSSKAMCRCVPPDSVADQLEGNSCGLTDKKTRCERGEYCKWTQEGDQVCSVKPYFATGAGKRSTALL